MVQNSGPQLHRASKLSDEETNYLERLLSGELRLHQLEKAGCDPARAVLLRRLFLEQKTSCNLLYMDTSSQLTAASVKSNIENMIGTLQVPLGVAGSLIIQGTYAKGSYYVPLATTEGALVASINRGCSALSKAGGVSTTILYHNQARSLLFTGGSAQKAKDFLTWVDTSKDELISAGEKTSSHLKILTLESFIIGRTVWLRIVGDTGEAMGMNMMTIAGKAIGEYITKQYPEVTFVSESGNACVDKKPSMMNLIKGRGTGVIAEAMLDNDIITSVLKTTPQSLIDINYRKNLLGGIVSGSLGHNAHHANMIAALYLATGQDVAEVVDGSLGTTTIEKSPNGIYIAVTLPALHVGTVGGGTHLPVQQECLSLLGLNNTSSDHPSQALAEICAATVLAGELSLLAALSSRDLSKAHAELNRSQQNHNSEGR